MYSELWRPRFVVGCVKHAYSGFCQMRSESIKLGREMTKVLDISVLKLNDVDAGVIGEEIK